MDFSLQEGGSAAWIREIQIGFTPRQGGPAWYSQHDREEAGKRTLFLRST